MMRAGQVACRGEYRVLVARPGGRRQLGRPRLRWEDNKWIFKQWDGEAWTGLLWPRIGTSGGCS